MAKLTFSFESAQPNGFASFPFSFDQDDAVRILTALVGEDAALKVKSEAEFLLDLGAGSRFSFPIDSGIVAGAALCRETRSVNGVAITLPKKRSTRLPAASRSYRNELDAVEQAIDLAKTGTLRIAVSYE
jgi:hypothetical protein